MRYQWGTEMPLELIIWIAGDVGRDLLIGEWPITIRTANNPVKLLARREIMTAHKLSRYGYVLGLFNTLAQL